MFLQRYCCCIVFNVKNSVKLLLYKEAQCKHEHPTVLSYDMWTDHKYFKLDSNTQMCCELSVTARIPGSHNSTNPGLSSAIGVFQSSFVPYHNLLVAVLAVPGALAAAQVVGGRRPLQLQLLLLPDQQRGVLEAQPREALRQRLLGQRTALRHCEQR